MEFYWWQWHETKCSNGPHCLTSVTESGNYVLGMLALKDERIMIDDEEIDPIADEWETEALCILGYGSNDIDKDRTCASSLPFEVKPNFEKSLGDEFGAQIVGDVPMINAALFIVIIYAAVMLSRFDSVHSMIGMSFVTALIVGLSYFAGLGLGAFFGMKNNNLNGNIPFLLLGLGVDDAFVLCAEFSRARRLFPKKSTEEQIGIACSHGGMSILITSITDAIAFLVGSITVLPALSWFCVFAGLSVLICFMLQLTLFFPHL